MDVNTIIREDFAALHAKLDEIVAAEGERAHALAGEAKTMVDALGGKLRGLAEGDGASRGRVGPGANAAGNNLAAPAGGPGTQAGLGSYDPRAAEPVRMSGVPATPPGGPDLSTGPAVTHDDVGHIDPTTREAHAAPAAVGGPSHGVEDVGTEGPIADGPVGDGVESHRTEAGEERAEHQGSGQTVRE